MFQFSLDTHRMLFYSSKSFTTCRLCEYNLFTMVVIMYESTMRYEKYCILLAKVLASHCPICHVFYRLSLFLAGVWKLKLANE